MKSISFFIVLLSLIINSQAVEDINVDPCAKCIEVVDQLKIIVENDRIQKLLKYICHHTFDTPEEICALVIEQLTEVIKNIDSQELCSLLHFCERFEIKCIHDHREIIV